VQASKQIKMRRKSEYQIDRARCDRASELLGYSVTLIDRKTLKGQVVRMYAGYESKRKKCEGTTKCSPDAMLGRLQDAGFRLDDNTETGSAITETLLAELVEQYEVEKAKRQRIKTTETLRRESRQLLKLGLTGERIRTYFNRLGYTVTESQTREWLWGDIFDQTLEYKNAVQRLSLAGYTKNAILKHMQERDAIITIEQVTDMLAGKEWGGKNE
jgi:hypothetical protein